MDETTLGIMGVKEDFMVPPIGDSEQASRIDFF